MVNESSSTAQMDSWLEAGLKDNGLTFLLAQLLWQNQNSWLTSHDLWQSLDDENLPDDPILPTYFNGAEQILAQGALECGVTGAIQIEKVKDGFSTWKVRLIVAERVSVLDQVRQAVSQLWKAHQDQGVRLQIITHLLAVGQ